MRTTEERIELMHIRAKEMKRDVSRRRLAGFGSASALLLVVLFAVMWQMNGFAVSISNDPFTGSSLLSENAGGYVLAAVIAFFIGVIITALIFRYRNKGKNYEE